VKGRNDKDDDKAKDAIPDTFEQPEEPEAPEQDDEEPEQDEPEEEAEEPDEDDDADEGDEPVTKAMSPEALRAIRKARLARSEARRELRRVADEAQSLREELESLRAAQNDPEPDPTEDPTAYKAWAKRDAERRTRVRAAPAQQSQNPEQARVGAMADAMRREHPDYDFYVNDAVRHKIHTDPKIWKKVYSAANPARAAYEFGKQVMDGDDEADSAPPPRKSGATRDGGFAPGRKAAQGGGRPSREAEIAARIFGIPASEIQSGIRR